MLIVENMFSSTFRMWQEKFWQLVFLVEYAIDSIVYTRIHK